VLGSLLGAAIITGSFAVGDTMDASIRQLARTHLGPIDELVVADGRSQWTDLIGGLHPARSRQIDGVLPLARLDAAAVSSASGVLRTAPHSQVLTTDFAAARRFGGDPRATGISGPTPAGDEVAITKDLADELDVGPGGVIDVYAYGWPTHLVVASILPRRGVAGFWLAEGPQARNVFVSPAMFDTIIRNGIKPGAPPEWAVAISNRGGVEDAVGLTGAVTRQVVAQTGIEPTKVVGVKKIAIDEADAVGKGFRDMFTSTGAFGVLAGLLLLVNLFVMLAAERKSELGMARAIGMKRGGLVGAFATEGWIYALAASLAGVAVGIGLGRLIVVFCERAFNTEHNPLELFFTVRPWNVVLAFAIAYVVAILTVVGTSVRVARLNIIRAIRDLREPPPPRRRRTLFFGAGALALGTLWTLASIQGDDAIGLLVGPVLVLAGLGPFLTRLFRRKPVVTALSALAVVWGAAAFALFPDAAEGASIMAYVFQGVVLTGAGVLLVAQQQEAIAAALSHLGPGKKLALRLGLAYPLARRSRTGLTVAMYALVVFILTFITGISHMIGQQVDASARHVRGGFDVVVSSTPSNPIRQAALTRQTDVARVAPLWSSGAQVTTAGITPTMWTVSGFDRRLVDGGAPALDDRGSYPSDRAAWNAVLSDPGLVIADPMFGQNGGPPDFKIKPGQRILLADPVTGARRIVHVAAIRFEDGLIGNGFLIGAPAVRSLFGAHVIASRAYVALNPGTDPEAWAASLQSRYYANGAEASSIQSLTEESFSMTTQVFQLFEGYLALGLVVGIAGLAVVMVRAVRERRREIGMVRAIGFPSHIVGRSFAIEATFIAAEGTLLGVSLALVTLYNIVTNTKAMGDLVFSVPWLTLTLLLVATVAVSLLATIGPAVSASRIRPAVALRVTD
jgi:putative ABC transport system permease protein